MKKIFENNNLIKLFAIIIVAVLLMTLFVFRLGISENGNFVSHIEEIGLYDVSGALGNGYFSDAFGVSKEAPTFKTYALAYDMFKVVGQDKIIYSYYPALVYSLIFIAAAFLLALCFIDGKSKWADIITAILFILMFCDSGYVMFFNTPYKEAAFIVYLMASLAFLLFWKKSGKLWGGIAFSIFAFLLGGVSVISAIVAVALAIYGIISKCDVKVNKIITTVLLIIVVGFSAINIIPDEFNAYDSVFFGITVESPYGDNNTVVAEGNSKEIIADLGIDAMFAENVGTSTITTTQEIPELGVKFSDVLGYYLKNPNEYLEKMKIVSANSTNIRTEYLGNFLPSTGKSNMQSKWFSLYSIIKKSIIPANYIIMNLILLVLIILSILFRRKYAKEIVDKTLADLGVIMGIASIVTMPLPFLMNGFTQINFNMLSFNFMFDVSLFLLVVIAFKYFAEKRNLLKEKFGVNQ